MMAEPGDILFQGSFSVWPDEDLVVEADGTGGAILMIIEGNYPIDYLVKQHHTFSSEEAACDAADKMIAATHG